MRIDSARRVIVVLGIALLVFHLCAAELFRKPDGRVVFGDAAHHYVQLRSIVFDYDFDFKNDYLGLYKITRVEDSPPWLTTDLTPTGRVRNYMPVGPALLWAPLFALMAGGLWLLSLVGARPPPDGFEHVLQLAPGITGVVAATVAAWCAWRLARRTTDDWTAGRGVIGIWLGSSALYYSLVAPSYSHAASMFACALFFLHWLDTDTTWTPARAVVSGALAGFASLMRWQDALLLAIPMYEMLRAPLPWSRRATGIAAAAVGWAVVFSPQMAVWNALYGRPLAMPQGPSFMQWANPHPLLLLFSDNHGLLTWTPIVALSLVGLFTFAKAHRRFALPLVWILLSAWYVNASVADWWAGEAFGARRFLSLFPLFALGLATWAGGRAPGRRAATIACVVGFTWLLLFQYELFMKGFRDIAPYPHGWFDFWLARFVVPFRLIAQLL